MFTLFRSLILHNFYSFSQGNFFVSCVFPLSFLSPLFYPYVTSVSGIKRKENKLLDFASSSDIYKTTIDEFYVIYYLTISIFLKYLPELGLL
jgi:hypothetical protein